MNQKKNGKSFSNPSRPWEDSVHTNGCVSISFAHDFISKQHKMMRNERTVNQRRSLRNRRNRQPTTPPNPNRVPIRYRPKLKYQNSTRWEDGVLILPSRKRAAPTAEEKQRRKQRKIQIKTAQVAKSSLQHKVINLYEHGAYFDAWQFPAKSSTL